MARPMALRCVEYWALRYRRSWRGSVATTFLFPVGYLAAIGLGLGSLVDRRSPSLAALGGVSYLTYLAPGLLAATAMQTAATEATWPVNDAVRWVRTYHAMLATPLGVWDVLVGHLAWMAVRLAMVCAAFLAVMALFGVVRSPWALAALPAGVLAGMAFAAPIAAFAATRDTDGGFAAMQRFVIVPLFLFSGAFFPLSELPPALAGLAWATPLAHGVALCRELVLGRLSPWPVLGHVAYLAAFTLGGVALAGRAFHSRLAR
ncbi:MAG: ABC transporter permease [Acidimicrobiales bacterium]